MVQYPDNTANPLADEFNGETIKRSPQMNNFNYNNYIGEHMVESLRVACSEGTECELYSTSNRNIELIGEYGRFDTPTDKLKPLIKSISDLTDEELLFVFGKEKNAPDNYFIKRGNNGAIYLHNINISITVNSFYKGFAKCNQQILNRLYSLHVSLDYDELINNNLAVRKDVK